MALNETYKGINDTVELFAERFNADVGIRQKNMWSTILKTIKKLELTATGNIKISTANIKILRELRDNISRTIITPQYKKDLETFLGGFDELKDITDTYYKSIASSVLNTNKNVFKAVQSLSIESTKNSLLEAGINNAIINPIQKLLTENITTGGTYEGLTELLRTQILGDAERLGSLERYSRQITTDALNQFNANYNDTVANDLGYEFYYYAGSIKETTREYCSNLIAKGRYYHKKEIQNTATQQWAGKIPSTNENNILINRGGYNCRHQWLATRTENVPKDVIKRAESKGYYKPKG